MKALGPPSSPPTAGCLLATRMRMARPASIQNTVTENPKLEMEGFCQKPTSHNQKTILPSDGDIECGALGLPVDSGDGPCDTDTKEDIDSVGASDVTDGVVSGLILNSSGL